MDHDVIIIGAGAAGMFAAIEASRRGRKVLVLEHNSVAGEKIRISGGGRCNFTNTDIRAERFLTQNPRFAISALRRFTFRDFAARLDAAGIAWHERNHGQLFCQGSATQVVAMLLADMKSAGAVLRVGCKVHDLRRRADGFEVDTQQGSFRSRKLVVATGGKSIPKMGATGFGYQIAEKFGIPVIATRAGLVPLTFGDKELDWMKLLAGVGLSAKVKFQTASFEEALLFTHRGLSGPAVLQISSYWREGKPLVVDFLPEADLAELLSLEKQANGRQFLRTALARHLPERFARMIETEVGETRPMAEIPRSRLAEVAQAVKRRELLPSGTEGYRTAEVTLGGVDTAALDGRTMEAKAVPGLYFIGEVVDVTGWLGGYNFQWAWSSGWVAGQAI